MKDLEHQIKELIIESLNLEDVAAADIQTDAPLFVDGLGLDSIDALELGLALQRRYGIEIGDSEAGREHFASVRTLAAFVAVRAPALKVGA
jgi:acyl carrier protein